MKRRDYLKRAGIVGAFGVVAGCPGDGSTTSGTDGRPTTSPESTATGTPAFDLPDEYAERFSQVVDLGAEGLDPDDSRPLESVLNDVADDDTLLYLPEGRYEMEDNWIQESFENIGLYGPEATIVPPPESASVLFVLGVAGEAARGAVVDGLTFDVSADNTGPRVIQSTIADDLLVRNVSVEGIQDSDQGLTRFDVTDPEGSGVVEGMSLLDGGKPGTLATGCLVGPRSEGTITFRDCHIDGFPDNGLYASPAPGTVRVHGGRYSNSGVSNVRVSGSSEVMDVHVICDTPRDGIENMRGIRLRNGAGSLVSNCLVELLDVTSSDGAITLASSMGPATIEDTTVRVDADGVPAIRAKPPKKDENHGDPEDRLQCTDVSIVGDAADGQSVLVVERADAAFEGLCVDQRGPNRDGCLFLRASEALVRNSQFDVTGEPIVTESSSVQTESITETEELDCGSRS